MDKEQEEVIRDVKIYIHDIISESVDDDGYTRYQISEEEQEFFNDIKMLIDMIRQKDKTINKMAIYIGGVSFDNIIERLKDDDVAYYGINGAIKQYFKQKAINDG